MATRRGLDKVLENLARLGLAALEASREGYDYDGGDAHDLAVKLGILVEVRVDEPCGDNCLCAESGDFPTGCFQLDADAAAVRDDLEKEG